MKKIPFEYRITITYIVLGALWILFSDKLVTGIFNDVHTIQTISISKGWLFILVTGLMLYLLIKKEIRNRTIIYNELLEAKKKADEADSLKSAFLSNLSHYIRTPMNSILGFVDLIKNKNTSAEKHDHFLKIINNRSDNLLQTLNSIIEIAKIQEGLYFVVKSTFSINEVINSIVLSAEQELSVKYKSVTIKTNFESESANDLIISDKEIVKQIITNLTNNAVNFIEEGSIEIGYLLTNDSIKIHVSDTGPGIPPEKKNIILEQFMHNASYTYTVGEGPGLGLYLSSQLAKLINGKLWLEASSNKGSTFCLEIKPSA
jgi:signal transduction histidine kinase